MYPYSNTKVTVELRELVENGVDIWDFDYPSYYKGDEKKAFEQKVIDHFYFRQIGQETTGRFLHMFRSRIREIMPYYIQMYKSVEIMGAIKDPFGNVDIIETFTQTTKGKGQSSTTAHGKTDSDNEHRFSNTPQGSIENIDEYLTEGAKDNSSTINDTRANSSASNEETVTHEFKKTGNQGVNTYAHDMIEFRESFINVDMMIINELNDLFLLVY